MLHGSKLQKFSLLVNASTGLCSICNFILIGLSLYLGRNDNNYRRAGQPEQKGAQW
jgi:hypothetical protein